MNIIVTGCVGFIGFHVTRDLLKNKNNYVIGIDSINNYYSKNLKFHRLGLLKNNKHDNFEFYKINLNNNHLLKKIFKKNVSVVIHFAAQAGVRYSLENPRTYIDNNLVSFFNIIDLAKTYKIKHFIFASSSSVYGNSKKLPLKEEFSTEAPLSIYAATKKSNELIAHSYSNMFNLPCTGLRFFTVYGPYGRPDMSLFQFTKNIINGKMINIYNFGKHYRDFTYIDDAVNFVKKIIKKPSKELIPYQIFNVGNSKPITLKNYINKIEKILRLKAKKRFIKAQIGDVYKTHAEIKKIKKVTNYSPKTKIEIGLKKFINWYKTYSIK